MSKATNNGWDFIKVGETYQYKEDWVIAKIKIIENNSDDERYAFVAKILASNEDIGRDVFEFSHIKNFTGYYNGMIHVYEHEEYYFPKGYKYNYE